MSQRNTQQQAADAGLYPGVAINQADDKEVDPKLVKERTRTLNNNPRNNKLDE